MPPVLSLPSRGCLSALILLAFVTSGAAAEPSAAPVRFEEHVRPLFKAYCFECHGEGPRLRGGLDLRLRRLLAAGGDSGVGLVPHKRDKSLLYERILSQEMPPGKKKLTKEEIDLIGRWIDAGALTSRPEPEKIAAGFLITDEDRAFWSFQPIRRPTPPVDGNPIDAFVLKKLQEKGLSFSPEADRRTLIRRAYFDLLGLPPTPDEVDRFLADEAPDAYGRLIDRLLESPHYGERWGRHWLDVAGYADSDGYTADDTVRPFAYQYRDYVIRSFNADKPWDQFIQEQLAGDELVRPPYDKVRGPDVDKLIATGFLRMAADGTAVKDVDQPLARNQVIADTIQIVSTSLLGMTMHCAQCHNHRYDPIPQTDYYSMRAIFEPALDWKNWRTPPARLITMFDAAERKQAESLEAQAKLVDQAALKLQQEHVAKVFERELAKVPETLRDEVRKARDTLVAKRTPRQKKLLGDYPNVDVTGPRLRLFDRQAGEEVQKLIDQAAALREQKPKPLSFPALTEVPGKTSPTFLFYRGDHEQPKETLAPAGLTILASLKLPAIPEDDPALPTTGRRLAFARQLTSGTHPLTARVLVNRFWLHHFGRGIVNSPGDLGFLGDRPSHLELLDWLASEFMANGWRLKPLHKLMMTSLAYRQDSKRTPELERIDPDNVLLGRKSIQRLEAETLRDAILAVSGKLNAKQFGPPVPVMPDLAGQIVIGVDTRDGAGRPTGKVVPLNGEEFRRSVYVQVRRSQPLAVLAAFDAPTMEPCCERRNSSTVTPQSLMLMNSEFVAEYARSFADRLGKESTSTRDQVKHGWRLAFAVEPSTQQIDDALRFIAEQTEVFQAQNRANARELALTNFCQALMSTNAFLYID